MYNQYIDHFYDLRLSGEPYMKYSINISERNLELDFCLSFTEFKNILTKELFDLDTEDLIKYGKDMYIFTIFNIYFFNSISSKVKGYDIDLDGNELKEVEHLCLRPSSKALVNVIK